MEVTLQEELIKAKEIEAKAFEDAIGLIKAAFLANEGYQKGLAEEADLKNTIANACIKLDLLQIDVKGLEDVTEYLNNKKDDLIE